MFKRQADPAWQEPARPCPAPTLHQLAAQTTRQQHYNDVCSGVLHVQAMAPQQAGPCHAPAGVQTLSCDELIGAAHHAASSSGAVAVGAEHHKSVSVLQACNAAATPWHHLQQVLNAPQLAVEQHVAAVPPRPHPQAQQPQLQPRQQQAPFSPPQQWPDSGVSSLELVGAGRLGGHASSSVVNSAASDSSEALGGWFARCRGCSQLTAGEEELCGRGIPLCRGCSKTLLGRQGEERERTIAKIIHNDDIISSRG